MPTEKTALTVGSTSGIGQGIAEARAPYPASDEPDSITDTLISVDGGWTAR